VNGNFAACLLHVLSEEGGYVNHPDDPGGETNLGITRATLERWLKREVTSAEIRALTYEQAGEIYETWYWKPPRCGEMPRGVDLMVFDGSVNSGPERAVGWLQRAVGAKVDGMVGPKTLAALAGAMPALAINRMAIYRMDFLRGLPTWEKFGKGWTARVDRTRAKAQDMAVPLTIDARLDAIEARLLAGGL
jgi:lysozyme family protein